jgi:hypothetical protein
VPKGFPLRVPRSTAAVADELLAALDKGERYASQVLDNQYRVRSAATRSPRVATQYHVSLAASSEQPERPRDDPRRPVINLPTGAQGGAATDAAREQRARAETARVRGAACRRAGTCHRPRRRQHREDREAS